MSNHNSGRITSGQSFRKGLLVSGSVGVVAAAITFSQLDWISFYPAAIASVLVGTGVAAAVLKVGYKPENRVELAHAALAETLGTPTGEEYAVGDHFTIPGVESVGHPVSLQRRMIDPPIFYENVGDRVRVGIDGFLWITVTDPARWLAVEHPDEMLGELFKSLTRTFIRPFMNPDFLNKHHDLLAHFLDLGSAWSPHHTRLLAELRELEVASGDEIPILSSGGADHIMESAGVLARAAEDFGSTLSMVEIEEIALPVEMTDAAAKRRAQEALSAQQKDQFNIRKEMASEILAMDTTGRLTVRDAFNLVDQQLGLGVTTERKEFELRDVTTITEAILGKLSPELMTAILAYLNRRAPRQPGQRTGGRQRQQGQRGPQGQGGTT